MNFVSLLFLDFKWTVIISFYHRWDTITLFIWRRVL